MLEIALDYRQEFHKDVVIDLIGFRRHGHNEGDEPTYTQPVMYRAIEAHPGVRTLYARRLVRDGVLTEEQVRELEARQLAEYEAALTAAKQAAQRSKAQASPSPISGRRGRGRRARDRRSSRRARAHRPRHHHRSGGVPPQPEDGPAARPPREDGRGSGAARLGNAPRRWRSARCSSKGRPSGSAARTRAAARSRSATRSCSTRSPASRGRPLATLDPKQAPFEACDSPLSEFAVLGFDYGYSVEWPEALVLWEAQFGDFANGAQVIIDQFIASAAGQVAPGDAHGHAPAARLGRAGARALERAHRALPSALRRRQHADRQRDDAGPVLPPAAAPDAAARGEAAGRLLAEEPPASARGAPHRSRS